MLSCTFATAMDSIDVPEGGVASVGETSVQQVVPSVVREETVTIDDEGTHPNAVQEVVLAAPVEESIFISPDTVDEGSHQDTVQEVDSQEGCVASVEETSVQQVVPSVVQEEMVTTIDDEGTHRDTVQEVDVAPVEESIFISPDTVDGGSHQDTTVQQDTVASVEESGVAISLDDASPPSMLLDAEVIIASLEDNINVSLEEASNLDVIAAGGISNPFKFSTAYVFEGDKDEFSKPLYHTPRKLNGLEKRFHTASLVQYSEFPISMFANWYAELPMVKRIVDNYTQLDIAEPWHFSVVILCPTGSSKSDKAMRDFRWGQNLAIDFYRSEFSGDANDAIAFTTAVSFDVTIMILGFPIGKKEDASSVFKGTIARRKDGVVIAAVTYRSGTEAECGTALILWFLVSPSGGRKPSQVSSWRRRGFGRFLLLIVIKRLTLSLLHFMEMPGCHMPLSGVDIYLQSVQPHACSFYHACGFVQINSDGTSGLELLPKSIGDNIIRGTDSAYAFIFANNEKDVPIALFRLRSGCLLNTAVELEEVEAVVGEDIKDKDPPSDKTDLPVFAKTPEGSPACKLPRGFSWESFSWCRFPSSTRHQLPFGDGSRLLKNSDLELAYDGLHLLDMLLPPPMDVLLHPSKMRIKGAMLSGSRQEHSQFRGAAWMKGSEVEMMLSLILRDGRYDSSVTIIPLIHMQKITMAVDAAQKCVSATNFRVSLMKTKRKEFEEAAKKEFMDIEKDHPKDAKQRRSDMVKESVFDFRAELDKLTVDKFGALEDELDLSAQRAMNVIADQVLVCYPGLLEKRIIVFPINFGNSHWGATFVFNASQIEYFAEGSTKEELPTSLRPAFFRYCSLNPSGEGMLSNKHGIIWFLNLAYSNNQHRKNIDMMAADGKGNSPSFTFVKPFGKNISLGNMLGTKSFPALRLLSKGNVLPLQKDEHSCGIGMVACIAIILRELLGYSSPEEITNYNEVFSPDSMLMSEETGPEGVGTEVICYIPEETLKPLPTSEKYPRVPYLHVLKAEWFVLFDRLAELQHVKLRIGTGSMDAERFGYFVVMKDAMAKCPWPSCPIISLLPDSPLPDGDMVEGITTVASLDMIPPPAKEWDDQERKSRTTKNRAAFVVKDPDDPEGNPPLISEERYSPFADELGDPDAFASEWRTQAHQQTKPMLLTQAQRIEMDKFVEANFVRWKWGSTKEHEKKLTDLRTRMNRELAKEKSPKVRLHVKNNIEREITFLKKERKKFTRSFQLEWKFSTNAMVSGLKYNPLTDEFFARLVYVERGRNGKQVRKEEVIPLSEEWIKEAEYEPGVIQHVINMGAIDDFVEVDPAEKSFNIHTKKVQRLRYVQPKFRYVPKEVQVGRGKIRMTEKGKTPMQKVIVPGHWMVMFKNETKAMRVDDAFVSNFPRKFLDEVKQMRCGFVDIPVGDFKISHLEQHPELIRTGAPLIQFTQSDGEDLCVSKSLASVLHNIGFTVEAEMLDNYGSQKLAGGTVNAYDMACQYAMKKLPPWIQICRRHPNRGLVESLLRNEVSNEVIYVGVLDESDGNASHAVTIHAGWIYDANETVAIPLSLEGMNYCCSTATVKNTFLTFRKLTCFSYDGHNKHKRNAMRLPRDRGYIPPQEKFEHAIPCKRKQRSHQRPAKKRRKLSKREAMPNNDMETKEEDSSSSEEDRNDLLGIASRYESFIPDHPTVPPHGPEPFPKKEFRLGCVPLHQESDESSSSVNSIEYAVQQVAFNTYYASPPQHHPWSDKEQDSEDSARNGQR